MYILRSTQIHVRFRQNWQRNFTTETFLHTTIKYAASSWGYVEPKLNNTVVHRHCSIKARSHYLRTELFSDRWLTANSYDLDKVKLLTNRLQNVCGDPLSIGWKVTTDLKLTISSLNKISWRNFVHIFLDLQLAYFLKYV